MCGIAGIFKRHGGEIDRDILQRMTDALHHRGPDESGYFFDNGIGFGHRRLSIIDLASGQQPMLTNDRRVALTYNGEIYNFKSLRGELESLGYRFETNCDTEVLLQAWVEWGPQCVNRLRGMFAFAIWDANREILFLARDRLGIKPLYFGFASDDSLVFG
ncbi:MAG: asparagine synthetase B, partial [Pseudomonadota bacterium]